MSAQRFVVLRHEPGCAGPRELHWDLMLESEESLRTWALEREPRHGETIAAMELPDHRKAYLDYEGPLSNQRGAVCQFDRGTYEKVSESPGDIAIRLYGDKLRSDVTLIRDEASQRWAVAFSSR